MFKRTIQPQHVSLRATRGSGSHVRFQDQEPGDWSADLRSGALRFQVRRITPGRRPALQFRESFFLFTFVLLVVTLVVTARADDSTAAFEQANKLYEQGKFAEAAAGYDKLVQSGRVSAALHFNLGNAWFKAGQTGRAILNYRLAERLTPRDPDLRANLQFARGSVNAGGPPEATAWRRWLGNLSLNEWAGLCAVAVWTWFSLLALRQWRPAWRGALRSYTLAGGLLTACAALCLGVEACGRLSTRSAVVTTAEAVVRYGPLDESQSAFVLRDGAELIILDEKEGWLQVGDARGRSGWVKRDQIVAVPGGR